MVHFQIFETIKKYRASITRFSGHRNRSRRVVQDSDSHTHHSNPVVAEISHDANKASELCADLRPIGSIKTAVEEDLEKCYNEVKGDGRFCVFQVDNALFEVPLSVLCQTDCMFSHLFDFASPDGGEHKNEGTEDNPICLDDTAEQFRDFLWAMYAYLDSTDYSPSTKYEFKFTSAHIQRLINIARLSNKYCVAPSESWSTELLRKLFSSKGLFKAEIPVRSCISSKEESAADTLQPPNQVPLLVEVLDTAILCQHEALQKTIEENIVNLLLSAEERQEFNFTQENIQFIQTVARKYGLKRLLGVSYYRELISSGFLPSQSKFEKFRNRKSSSFTTPLDQEKIQCFSLAYQSLLDYWKLNIQNKTPSFRPSTFMAHTSCSGWGGNQVFVKTECRSHSECLKAWKYLWLAAELSEQSSTKHSRNPCSAIDILKRLEVREATIMSLTKHSYSVTIFVGDGLRIDRDCYHNALRRLAELRTEIVDGLADHFFPHHDWNSILSPAATSSKNTV